MNQLDAIIYKICDKNLASEYLIILLKKKKNVMQHGYRQNEIQGGMKFWNKCLSAAKDTFLKMVTINMT